MAQPTRVERWRYRFDTWMSRGTIALIGLLSVVSFLFVLVVALIVWALPLHPADEPEGDFFDIFWGNLMRTLDPGTMGGDEGWGFRIAMLIVTLGGLVIVASLIGIVSGGFDAKVAELRKGRSRVIESDHTLILGWNDKVPTIVRELAIANASRRRAAVVILADRDKIEMEDELRAIVSSRSTTRIICRSGDPVDRADLSLGSPDEARSVIVLAPEHREDADAEVIKTVLAVRHRAERAAAPLHIVAELRHASNREAAELVGGGEVQWVLADELIGRITVQTCRGPGLSVAYSELLEFDGHEMYVVAVPEVVGERVADVQFRFEDSLVIGIASPAGVVLNPAPSTIVGPQDRLVMIAEDDSAIRLSSAPEPDFSAINISPARADSPQHTIILGHNGRLATLLAELDAFAVPGSSAVVVADVKAPVLPEMRTLELSFRRGQVADRSTLDALGLGASDRVIVLADHRLPIQQADARTIITLLHLREIAERASASFTVVSEMLDDRNRELAEVTHADDFIVSDRIVALVLAQLSESPALASVFEELFSASGCELSIRPVGEYVAIENPLSFSTLLAAAQERGETAVGYRIAEAARAGAGDGGIVLNPHKGDVRRFAPDDGLLVLVSP